ncbi:MAG TPA: globin domain-containing protein [Alphaproteobacteria bacterium]|nr:globin domain-containing protein [Alphaproteobacteria bacterium]
MTPDQIALVESTFKRVAVDPEGAAALFYDKLFTLDPELRPLFKGDMREQGRKLMATLALAVSNIRRMETLVEPLKALGAKHRGYGVKPQHYQTVANALLATLATALGDDFTPEAKEAWTQTYLAVAGAMQA